MDSAPLIEQPTNGSHTSDANKDASTTVNSAAATESQSGKTLVQVAPASSPVAIAATTAVSVSAPVVPEDETLVASTLTSLRSAFKRKLTRSSEQRVALLKQLRALLTENEDAIYTALASDLGRCRHESWLGDLALVTAECDEAIAHTQQWMRRTRTNTNLFNMPARSYLQPEPLGVVTILGAWNYPIQLLLAPLIAALAAGNCVVLKPSELAPAVSVLMAELFSRPAYAQLAEVVKVIQGGRITATELLKHPVDLIFYTGGGAVARIISRAAAEHLTPVVLELGGKSPCVILRDCNLRVAARRVMWAKCLNAGQTCIAPDYALVDEYVYDEFVSELKKAKEEMFGDEEATKQSKDFARIISDGHTQRLSALLQSEPGVSAVIGGAAHVDAAAKYVPPTVLVASDPSAETDAVSTCRAMQDEIFGPILPVIRLRSIAAATVTAAEHQNSVVDAAIEFILARPKPLSLYVFTSSSASMQRFNTDTSSGALMQNDCIVHCTNSSLPFGGVGASGVGAYHGRIGFNTFSHMKPVMERNGWTLLDAPQRYAPYTPANQKFLRGIFRVQGLALYKPWWYLLLFLLLSGVLAVLLTKFAGKLW